MRSPLDRLRQALSFEIIALVLAVPLGTVAFGVPMHDVGVVSVVSATIATLWNVVYNFVFDVTYKVSIRRRPRCGQFPINVVGSGSLRSPLCRVLGAERAWRCAG